MAILTMPSGRWWRKNWNKPKVPDISLKQNFEKALQAEISKSDSASAKASADKQVFFSPWVLRVAAAVVLVMVGVAIGNWINTTRQHDQELAKLKEEVENNKRVMLSMLENRQS